jgi:hypothetical protein
MQVLPSFKNLFSVNGYLGEAPQLSSTYAQYDNGKYVFVDYWNFAGTNFPSGWYVLYNDTNTSYHFDNGYYSETGNNGVFQFNTNISINPSQLTPELYIQMPQGGNIRLYNSQMQFYSDTPDWGVYANYSGSDAFSTSLPYTSNYTLLSMYAEPGTRYFGENNTYVSYSVSNPITSSQLQLFTISTNGILNVKYIFFRETLLSMPTFTIGAFTNMTDHVDVSYLSNSITIPMPNWFNLTLKAYTNYSFTFQYNNTPLYFTYDGLINNTIYTGFFDHNLTLDIHFIALGYSGKTQSIVLERG